MPIAGFCDSKFELGMGQFVAEEKPDPAKAFAGLAIGGGLLWLLLKRRSRIRKNFELQKTNSNFDPAHIFFGRGSALAGVDDVREKFGVGSRQDLKVFDYSQLVGVERITRKVGTSWNELVLHIMTTDSRNPSFDVPFLLFEDAERDRQGIAKAEKERDIWYARFQAILDSNRRREAAIKPAADN